MTHRKMFNIAISAIFTLPFAQFILSGHVPQTEMAMSKSEICAFLRDHATMEEQETHCFASDFVLTLMNVIIKFKKKIILTNYLSKKMRKKWTMRQQN